MTVKSKWDDRFWNNDFSKTYGLFNVGQYTSYYWLSLTCYKYMYNQGTSDTLQVQVIYCEFMFKTWSKAYVIVKTWSYLKDTVI